MTREHERQCIALVGSGTAGHVNPALAVAAVLSREHPDVRLLFLGNEKGQETALVPAAGYELINVAGAPFYGVDRRTRMTAPWHLLRGALRARAVLKDRNVGVVMSFGSYTSAGVAMAARSLGVPIVVHEANAEPGLANRWVSRAAHRVCLGFDLATAEWSGPRSLFTGTPVRPEFEASPERDGGKPRDVAGAARVLVSGGSLGSGFLNREVPEVLATVRAGGVELEVEHHTAGLDHRAVVETYSRAGIPATVVARTERMADACRWADLAITRAGAITIAELAASALPALLVPFPTHARGHQTDNARACERSAGTWWESEGAWSRERIAERLSGLLTDREALRSAGDRMKSLGVPGAARRVAAECVELLGARR